MITKQKACGYLASVPLGKEFSIINGPTLSNLYDLSIALKRMNKFQFKHHVNENKNDFHNWVVSTVKDMELAKNIKTVKDIRELSSKVNDRIDFLDEVSRL